jgi:hypothetical protein
LDSPADLSLEYDAEDQGGNADKDQRRSPSGRDQQSDGWLPIQSRTKPNHVALWSRRLAARGGAPQ